MNLIERLGQEAGGACSTFSRVAFGASNTAEDLRHVRELQQAGGGHLQHTCAPNLDWKPSNWKGS